MVRPILLYCSDFWGCLKHPQKSPISKLHMSFCKQLLGFRKQTHNNGVLLELGATPILFNAIKAAIKNWERIRKHNCNKLLIAAYNEALLSNLPWATSIKETFARNGMLNVFSSVQLQRGNQLRPNERLYKRLVDQFHQNSFSEIQTTSRMQFYSKLKTEPGREKYLHGIKNVKHRQSLSRNRGLYFWRRMVSSRTLCGWPTSLIITFLMLLTNSAKKSQKSIPNFRII